MGGLSRGNVRAATLACALAIISVSLPTVPASAAQPRAVTRQDGGDGAYSHVNAAVPALAKRRPGQPVPSVRSQFGVSQAAPSLQRGQQRPTRAAPVGGTWTFLGPKPVQNLTYCCTTSIPPQTITEFGKVSGRVTSLVVDPTNAATVYAGTAGGGVWKSADSGTTWTQLTDSQASLAIGALAIDPTGQVIYAGTGEDNNNGDAQAGLGILKSTNGGTSWVLLGSVFAGHHIGGIAVDRTTSGLTQRLMVASDIGLYVSTDGGATWAKDAAYAAHLRGFVGGPPVSGAVTQVTQDPTTPTRFWIAAGDGCLTEAGDLLSWDGASTWSRATPRSGPVSTTAASRYAFGVATASGNTTVWLTAARCVIGTVLDGTLLDVQTSANAATTWTIKGPATPGLIDYFDPVGAGGQGEYDTFVAIDPNNVSNVVLGGVTALASTDGGATFKDIGDVYGEAHPHGAIHPDFHAIAFTTAAHFYIGNDGGVYSTADLGGAANAVPGMASDWTNLNNGLATIQFYAGTALDPSHVLGGAQDNGTSGSFPGGPAQPSFPSYLGGDGGYTAIDPTPASTTIYAEVPTGSIFRGSSVLNPADPTNPPDSFVDAGPCRLGHLPADPACSDPTAFTAPFRMDQGNPLRLAAATNKVYLSLNGGGSGGPSSWTAISGDLTTGTLHTPAGDRIGTLAMGPRGRTGVVMTGSDFGKASMSLNATDASATWTDITGNLPAFPGFSSPSFDLNDAWISGLTFNPANPSEAWATIGGIGVGHVWHTTTAGGTSTWSNIDGTGLTAVGNVVVNDIILDPAQPAMVYLATDSGVLVCQTCGGPSPNPVWTPIGTNLPTVRVNALSLGRDNATLFAWTYGRGVWDTPTQATHQPLLVASPSSLSFSQPKGGTAPASQTLTIANDGNASLTWSLTTSTTSGGNWLTAMPSSGTTPADNESPVTVGVTATSGLAIGTYQGSIAVASNGGSATIPVTLTITPPQANATTLHFPALMNNAYGSPGYTTTIYLENASGGALAAGAITIIYYDQNGAMVGVGDTSPALVSKGVWVVPQSNGNGFVSGQAGSGVVYTSAAVTGFVNQEIPGGDGSSYTAIPHPNTAATVYAPAVMNNAYGGYTTGMGITNAGTATTTVTVTYHDPSGALAGTRTRSLAPNAFWGLYQGDLGTPLPQGFAGTAVLSTSPAQPLGLIVNETNGNPASAFNGQFLTYVGSGIGASTLYAPVVFRNAYGGFNTGMGIQNVGASAATVTINYSGQVGSGTTTQTYTETFTVPAGGYVGDYNGRTDLTNPLPDQFHGSATISSTQPLVEILNETQTGHVAGTSYNSFTAGTATVNLPLVENGLSGFNTGLGIENVGTGSATITITYTDPSSGAVVGTSSASPLTLAPGQFAGVYQGPGGDGGVPAGTRAVATFTVTNPAGGGVLAVIVNQTSASSFMSYTSQVTQAGGTGTAVAYQIDAAHTGNQPNVYLSGPLVKKWGVTLDPVGKVSYPLVAGGKVFVTVADNPGYGSRIYALNEATGATVWGPIELGGTYFWSAISFDANRVFALNFGGQLRAFDAATGAQLWISQMAGQYAFSAAPTASNGVVYVSGAGSGGTVYAVSEATGTTLWTAPVWNGDQSSPAVSGSGVYVSYSCPNAYGLTPSTGAQLWMYPNPRSCSGGGGKTAALYNSRVYVRDSSGSIVLNASTGTLVNTFAAGPIPAFNGSTGYFLNGGTLKAIDLGTSVITWTFAGDGTLSSAPLVVNGTVYVGATSGNLYALDGSTGTLLQTLAVGAGILAPDEQNVSQPLTGLAAGDSVLVVPATNQLVAFGN